MATPSHTNLVGRSGPFPVHAIAAASTTESQAGGLADAPLGYGLNAVADSASAGDAVALPECKAGAICIVTNNDATVAFSIYPNSGDTIDGGSADAEAGSDLAAGATRIFYGDATGSNWVSIDSVG